MRKLLLILVAVLSVACSTTPRTTATLKVIGVGATEELARQNGFKQAIELHVGSVILDEREAREFKLVKDDLLNYSAGYVDYYQVIDAKRFGNEYRLEMIVKVSSSKIAERILKQNIQPAQLNGIQMRTTYDTYLNHVNQGDALIRRVMSVFPDRAFNIEMKPLEYKINVYRESVIEVPYVVTWNHTFQEALREALDASQDVSESDIGNAPYRLQLNMRSGYHRFGFIDSSKMKLVLGYVGSNVGIKMSFRDSRGQEIFAYCEDANIMGDYLMQSRNNSYVISSRPYRNMAQIKIDRNDSRYHLLSKVTSMTAEPMNYAQCKNSL